MSTSTGNFVYSANRPDLANGDENDFNVSVSGPINLNFNVDSAGNLSGTASLTSSVQGSTPDDQDGDDDSFSDSGSGTGTLTGSLSSGVQASGSLSNGGAFSFQGTFANQATTINGVITLTDPNLPGSVNANVSLSSSLTPFPSTPMPVNIDAGGFAFDQAYDGLVDKSAVNAAQIFLKSSKGISLLGNPPPTSFPSGLQATLGFLGEEVHGNALPWGNVGSAATSRAVGKVLTLAGVFNNAYDVGTAAYQNGVFSTPALQADVKLVAAMASGYVGEMVSGGAVAGYVGAALAEAGLAPAAAGLIGVGAGFVAPVIAAGIVGVALYTVGSYVLNGKQVAVVDGVDVCGPQDVQNQAQTYLVPAPGSGLVAPGLNLAAATQASSSAPLSFGNALLLTSRQVRRQFC